MPVTVRPSSKTAEHWETCGTDSDAGYTRATSSDQLLSTITTDDDYSGDRGSSQRRHIVQSSFGDLDQNSTIFATKNGLVHSCIEAYNDHHNLVLRPEDIWFAILTQLSTYVNANADQLRSQFVDHTGQLRLEIVVESLEGLDHGAMAYQMTKLMGDNLRDPELRDWVLPAFSTTNKCDQTVASIIFMGTMQKYFTYSWGTRCGIPAVTLLGEMHDWIKIAERCASRLGGLCAAGASFGLGARRWYHDVLRPVLAGFIETFRAPEGPTAQHFWKGIVDRHEPNGSGKTTYTGWITAFCYWDEEGKCLHRKWGGASGGTVHLSRSDIPMGFVKVPVTLLDNSRPIPTEMVAGSVGMRVRKADEKGDDKCPGPSPTESSHGSSSYRGSSYRGSSYRGSSYGNSSYRGSSYRGSSYRGSSYGNSSYGNSSYGSYGQPWEGYDTVQPETGWFMYKTEKPAAVKQPERTRFVYGAV